MADNIINIALLQIQAEDSIEKNMETLICRIKKRGERIRQFFMKVINAMFYSAFRYAVQSTTKNIE